MKNAFLKKTNKIISVCLLLFGVGYLYFASQLTFGSWQSPKTGFLPMVAGVGMTVLSLFNMIIEFRKADEVPEELREVNWVKAFLYIGTCALYVIMLELGFGYLISTPVCLFLMIKFTGIKSWLVPIAATVLVTAFFYGVFNVVMGVYLPRITIFNI